MDATDLDAVLENISLLIGDMEDNINETKVTFLFFISYEILYIEDTPFKI